MAPPQVLDYVAANDLKKDTVIEVEVYKISDYKSSARQYEMHHLNTEVKTSRWTIYLVLSWSGLLLKTSRLLPLVNHTSTLKLSKYLVRNRRIVWKFV